MLITEEPGLHLPEVSLGTGVGWVGAMQSGGGHSNAVKSNLLRRHLQFGCHCEGLRQGFSGCFSKSTSQTFACSSPPWWRSDGLMLMIRKNKTKTTWLDSNGRQIYLCAPLYRINATMWRLWWLWWLSVIAIIITFVCFWSLGQYNNYRTVKEMPCILKLEAMIQLLTHLQLGHIKCNM